MACKFLVVATYCLAAAGCSAHNSAVGGGFSLAAMNSETAPPLGPYSSAVCAGGVLYVSGVIGFDYSAQQIPLTGFIAQAEAAFDNLEAVLADTGSSLDRVVKVAAFLKSPDDMKDFNAVYEARLGARRPARTTVPGADWGASGVVIELDVTATC